MAPEHNDKMLLLFVPQFDRAVQLYLETEAENSNYYLDSILACLVATVKSTGASQSTIKLVATSLIANGKLSGKSGVCVADDWPWILLLSDQSMLAFKLLANFLLWL